MAQLLAVLAALSLRLCCARAGMDSCYGRGGGAAQRCLPEFCNAAFNRTVLASAQCGAAGPELYCLQTGVTGVTQSCHVCDARQPQRSHGAQSLNDFHIEEEEPSWWQSPSMVHGVQYPNSVNLSLALGKAFEITYIRLKFHTSRPESFAIYKRTREGGPWVPYQYYSASCRQTYGATPGGFLRPGDEERVAFCTDEFSDISPLTGGNVAFSTLEGRPSAYSFDTSPMLQEWVTATDLLISLNRLNTFGDDIFHDNRVLRSYYYAISDLSVGGRCKCNGHASECVTNGLGRLVCDCQHNTTGVDCQKCRPFFHDRPWGRASSEAVNHCLPCNCSGRSEQCVFNADQYRRTGHGGQCLNCRDRTAGAHCQLCAKHCYRDNTAEPCQPCNCSLVGSLSLQCDQSGDCLCKATVMGKKCEHCRPGYHSLSEGGCRPCACYPAGSVGDCSPLDGKCTCKQNVEGALCHSCQSGTFHLQPHNPHGCTNCFCYGHSAACTSASQFMVQHIVSTFQQDTDGWRGQNSDGGESPLAWEKNRISLFPKNGEWEYFIAPAKFLGNQLLSYRQNLSFVLDVESEELAPFDLTLEGSGIQVRASVSPQARERAITFRLHEAEAGIQAPALSSFQFQQLLSNLTAIRLAGSGSFPSHLKEVTLVTAQAGLAPRAAWVEECLCPEGYIGQFCQACAPDYKRGLPSGGPLTRCIPCTCNQHGTCDPDTGVCRCVHNTDGPSCEHCASGYYGNPFRGRYNDCKPCPCPAQSNCATVEETKEVVCTDCPEGQTGKRCEMCDDGYFGDPLGQRQYVRPCSQCQCNGNTDPNAVGNCDHVTGECLKCLFRTIGHYCDRCDHGFYGNALAPNPLDKCQPCDCDPAGSANGRETCNTGSGQCECLPHVIGRDCSQCEPGFYNLQPTVGCLSCRCHAVGSRSGDCQAVTGRCSCRPGIEGRSCDRCQRGFFELSEWGCRGTESNRRSLGPATRFAEPSPSHPSAPVAIPHRWAGTERVHGLSRCSSDNLTAAIEDLESALQSKDQRIEELLVQMEPRVKSLNMGIETQRSYEQLLNRVEAAQASARASIEQAKGIKDEGITLLKTLEDNKKLFPAKRLKSKGAFRKMGPIRERVLVEARGKTAVAGRMLGAAESSSAVSNGTAARASLLARDVTKEAQKLRRRAQDQSVRCGSLRAQVATAEERLGPREEQAAALRARIREETQTATQVLGETETTEKSMKKAKHSLDRDVKRLAELLKQIESLQVGQATEEMLNKTESQMGSLRWAIDRKLTRKVRELEAASEMQILKMRAFEKDIEEIQADKLNLEDIVQNLPQGCYSGVGQRRQ
uniref:laminin subunit gamma-3-like n=1 Tax=Pristiophorus japonicus TaxID=55135 RepID=UPI00398E7DE0